MSTEGCIYIFDIDIEASCKPGKLFSSTPPGLSCPNEKEKQKKSELLLKREMGRGCVGETRLSPFISSFLKHSSAYASFQMQQM